MPLPADSLDRRRNAFRPDLADVRLEGRVASQRFVAGPLLTKARRLRHAG